MICISYAQDEISLHYCNTHTHYNIVGAFYVLWMYLLMLSCGAFYLLWVSACVLTHCRSFCSNVCALKKRERWRERVASQLLRIYWRWSTPLLVYWYEVFHSLKKFEVNSRFGFSPCPYTTSPNQTPRFFISNLVESISIFCVLPNVL